MQFKLILILTLSFVHAQSINQNERPSLEISPKYPNISLPEGESSLFTCSGLNHNPAFFDNLKWFDPKGREINADNEFYRSNYAVKQQHGKTILRINNPTDNLSGRYTCKGTFQKAIDLSESIQVSFYQDITWLDCPSTQALIKDTKDARIRCKVSAKPPAELNWSKDSGDIKSNDRFIRTNDGLQVNGLVDKSLEGKYEVEAHVTETGKIKYNTIVVSVYTFPEIVNLKSTYEVVEDEEAILECRAIGLPAPRHYWFDPQIRNLSTIGGYVVDTNTGQLTISKVNKENVQGDFTCLVENAAGKVNQTTKVNVLSRPKITEFKNSSAVQNQNGHLSCLAIGNPAPELEIRKDGQSNPITAGGNYNVETFKIRQYESKLTMNIYNVQHQDDGIYYCLATNKIGKQDQIGHLQVEFKPDLSETPKKVKTWGDFQVNLTCIVNSIPNATVSWYFRGQQIRPSDQYQIINEDQLSNFKNGGTGRNYLLVQPHPSNRQVYGEYTCRAENKHGYDVALIELSQALKPSFQNDPELFTDSPTSIKIRIPTEIVNDGGLRIKTIKVKYRERNESESIARVETFPFDNELILRGLLPRRTYFLSFSLKNDVGYSDWTSNQEKIMPKESVPDCPKFTYSRQSAPVSWDRECGTKSKQPVDADLPDKFDVKWLQPNDGGRQIEFYTFRVYPVIRTLDGWNRIGDYKEMFSSSRDQLVHHLTHLRPNTTYEVELRAKNEQGYSSSSYLVFRTSYSNDASTFQEQITKAFTNFQLMLLIVLITIIVILIVLDIVLYVRYDFGLLFCICHGCSSSDRHHAVKKIKNSHSLNTKYQYHRSSAEIDPIIMNATQKDEFKAELENRLVRMPKNSAV